MAAWKQSMMTFFADALRLTIRACLLVDGILLALFSIWFCWNLLRQLMTWCARVLFSSNW